MTKKEFLNRISNGKIDLLQIFLDTMAAVGTDYCDIGGLAVNAYTEPVVSLDLDIIIATKDVESLCLADILRLVESFPDLKNELPDDIQEKIE